MNRGYAGCAVVVAALVLVGPIPPVALADGGGGQPVTCTDQGACLVVAHRPGQAASTTHVVKTSFTSTDVCIYPRGSGNVMPCYDPATGWLNTSDGCHYRAVSSLPSGSPFTTLTEGYHPPGDGAYYLQSCMGIVGRPPGAVALVQFVVWRPTPPPNFGGLRPPPAVLAQRAVALLGLGAPQITLSPPANSQQVVGLPTWMWTPVSQQTWTTHSATAAVTGESVTATARAVSITWSTGDGNTVVCRNPGTPYSSRYDPHQQSPTCGYVYRDPSSTAGGWYRLTATTTWRVSWAGAGATGQVTLRRSSTANVRVVEAEAVNR